MIRSGALAVVSALALAGCASAPAPTPVEPERGCGMDVKRLLGDELERRPRAAPEDLYGLVREAILGDGPASEAELEAALVRAGTASPEEPIVEELDETTGTLRLNLRKWRFVGGTARELAPVVACSAGPPSPEAEARLSRCLDEAATVAGPGLARLVGELRGEGLPPVHNSANYVQTYRPAWRVVLRRCLPPWVTAPPPGTG